MNTRLSPQAPLFLAALLVAPLAMGVAPTPDELSAARQWAAAKFQGREETPKPQPGLPNEQRAPSGRPPRRSRSTTMAGPRTSC